MPPVPSGQTTSDLALIEQVSAGDHDAASGLVQRLYPVVIKVVRSHLPRRTSEEDLVQIVYARVFEKLEQFQGTAPLEHWVSRIAVNTCLNQLKHERVRPELRWADLTEDEEQVVQTLVTTTEDVPGSEAFAARQLVEKLLERLDPQDRYLVRALHIDEQSVDDIRRATGWSAARIKVRAFRARQKMKRFLKTLMNEKPYEQTR